MFKHIKYLRLRKVETLKPCQRTKGKVVTG